MPYVRESALWPVLVALLGHVVIVIAPILLGLARGNAAMALPLTMLVMGSFWLCKTDVQAGGRPGAVSLVVLLTWLMSALTGWAGGASGLL
jgi:hypothetical protein